MITIPLLRQVKLALVIHLNQRTIGIFGCLYLRVNIFRFAHLQERRLNICLIKHEDIVDNTPVFPVRVPELHHKRLNLRDFLGDNPRMCISIPLDVIIVRHA